MSGTKCTPLNIYAPNNPKAQLKSILKKHPCKSGRRPQFFCGNESTSENLEKTNLNFSQPSPTVASQIEALDFDNSCLSQPCIEPKRIAFAQDLNDKSKKKRIVLTGDVPSPVNRPSGCHFHPRWRIGSVAQNDNPWAE